MKDDRKKIDEEKSYNCPIDVNDILDADLQNANSKTNGHHKKHVGNFRHVDFASFGLLQPENAEDSFSG